MVPIELPNKESQTKDPIGLGPAFKVIVLDDNHNTFESVSAVLSRVIPGVSYDNGLKFATEIHTKGQAIVWMGHKELAEHYHDLLLNYGLTVAPLED